MNIINDYFVLIAIPAIYFLVAITKSSLQKLLKFNICAICVAVSLSWLSLLVLWIIGYQITEINLAILMGMSISGIMYKMENYFKTNAIRNFWLIRLVIIVGGFYAIQSLLNKNINLSLFLIIGGFLLIALFVLFGSKNDTDKVANENPLYKKLEDCC